MHNRYKYHLLMFKTTFPWAEELPLVSDNDLSHLPPAVSCPVYSTFVENLLTEGQNHRQTIGHPPALLQLRGPHLLLYDPAAKQVLHSWRCQPDLYFRIREGSKAVLQQKGKGEENTQAFSIVQMGHSALPQQRLTFIVSAEDKKALEYFGIALEKCAIIQKDFHQKFKPLRKLGKGATAAVYSAVRHRDSTVVAVKAFNKSAHFSTGGGKGKKAFEQELRILTQCHHENLCGFEGVFETQNTIYLVMPSYQRTLTYLLHSSGPIHRKLVTAIMRQLLSGVAYLHSRGVMHRDLKLENIMLYKTEEGTRLIIIDMGMAEFVSSQVYLFEQCGTPGYVGPEIFGKRPTHPEKCDIFSLGVIFHILLFKKPVFAGNSGAQVCLNNRAGKLNIDPQVVKEEEAVQDLLMRMLEVDNSKRISAKQALKHDLFASSVKTPELTSTQSDLETSGVLPMLNL